MGLLLQTAATVADDGDESTDISVSLAKQVATEISEIAVSDEGIDLTSSDTLTTVLSEAVAEVAPEVVVEDAAIAAVASSVATVNTVVADPTLDPLSDVAAEIVESAQEELQSSVADVVSGEVSVEAFEDATDTTELFADVVIAVVRWIPMEMVLPMHWIRMMTEMVLRTVKMRSHSMRRRR